MTSTLLALLILSNPQQAAKADVAAVKGAYPGLVRVFESKDWDAADKLIAQDFIHVSPTREKIDKIEFLKGEKQSLAPLQNLKFVVTKLFNFTTTPAGTSVEVSWTMTASMPDKRRKHKVKADGTEMHVWKNLNGRWVLEAIYEHRNRTTIDGKVVQTSSPKATPGSK